MRTARYFALAAAAAALIAGLVAPSAALAADIHLGDAYAIRGANDCSWRVGTDAVEKTLSFDGQRGTYALTSFKNKLAAPAAEYVDSDAPSPELRFKWDGNELTGTTPGWKCRSGDSRQVTVGGQPAIELVVVVERSSVRVTKHYVIYPRESLIREWTQYANIDSSKHTLARPSFLDESLMGSDVAAGQVQLRYMTGALGGGWKQQTPALTSTYARDFDSWDSASCVSDPSKGDDAAAKGTPDACAEGTAYPSSFIYIPWFSLWNTSRKDGVYMGFDYFGHWQAPIGNRHGQQASLSVLIPDYDSGLGPGQSVTSPKAFVGTYAKDEDDMTNRLLDWQYRYMWDETRPDYFTNIRMLGYWWNGAQCRVWGMTDTPDYAGTLQKVFGLVDHMRSIGADTYHRDCGWWDKTGDWNGPDWRISKDYLSRYGMQQLIYYYAYQADSDSAVIKQHPDWLVGGVLDLTNPDARKWMEDLLVGNAKKWGDYQWRGDGGMVAATSGAQELGQDQGLRTVIRYFLDHCQGCALQGVNSGGGYVGWDYMRLASSFSIVDGEGTAEQQDASRLFPTDKMSGIPDGWDPSTCDQSWNKLLAFNPDFTGDTSDPQRLECMRKLVELYHYLKSRGVVGRWVRQYHPHATDDDRNWFERLSGDGKRGLVIYKGKDSSQPVTVYPKGLDPNASYDVRFEFASGSSSRLGHDLMDNGITLSKVAAGELVFLGLPGHPGSGTDHTAPTAPTAVEAQVGTNMNYAGVEVSWKPGADDNWVSRYEVLRDGQVIGTAAKGTFFFDHTPGATPTATYAVRTVDGDGNRSAATSTAGSAGSPVSVIDDDPAANGGVTYSGDWSHASNRPDAFDGTLSTAGTCRLACQGFSNVQGANNWRYQDRVAVDTPSCHLACQGFSDVQGANNWRYQDKVDGTWQDMKTYVAAGYNGMRQWHDDTGGFVWPTAEHPGPSNDSARTWTAPRDGVVDISSHVAKLGFGGDGVVLRITRNGDTIWGPRTLDGTDTTGFDANVSNVTVVAGDAIRFEINNNGTYQSDATTWDPDITYEGTQPPAAAVAADGKLEWQDIKTYAQAGYLGFPQWHDDTGGFVWPAAEHPGPSNDTARTWIAPRDGVVDINSHVGKQVVGGDGVVVKITKNESTIWGPKTLTFADTSGFDANVSGVTVSAGDAIRFEINNNGSYSSDATSWDPDIVYHGDQTPAPSAEYTFTAREITWYAKLGPDMGRADVLIDGKPDATVDLYAPDANNWSIPVYSKTFASPGRHTIRIVGTRTGGISVDGLQTSTPGARVTEDGSNAIAYSGSGWTTRDQQQASGGAVTSSGHAGDSATFAFTGRQVEWIGRHCADCGEADVYVDGKYVTRVDVHGYRGQAVWQTRLFAKSWPDVARHTLKIVVTGTKAMESGGTEVDVDSFHVTPDDTQ